MAKVESVGANKVKIEVEVSPENFAAALQEAYMKTRGKFSIQGFRKGKAPRPVIENFYGEGIFYEEAFEIVFPDSYANAVDELNIVPVSRPDIDIASIGKKDGVVYTAEFFVKPDVTLGEYKGVEAEEAKAKLEEAQVDDEIDRMVQRNVRWVDVEREAREKDKVIIDYSGSIDGEVFQDGTAENQSVEIGAKMFIPGFEEQVVGMKKGEEKDIAVTFPDGYHAKNMAGKEAVFHIKLHDIKEKELPELNDEFAQDVSEFDTLEEYKDSIRKRLEERANDQAKRETENNVIEQVVKTAAVDIPECMIENQIDNQLRQIEYSLMYQGLKFEDYLKVTGGNIEALRKEYKEPAEKAVRTQLVIEAVMKAEGIEATQQQIEDELKTRAERMKKDLEEYKNSIGEEEMAYIKESLAYDNTVSFLVENAKLKAPVKKAKKEQPKKEETKKEQPKKEETKKEQPKKEETKKEQPKKEKDGKEKPGEE